MHPDASEQFPEEENEEARERTEEKLKQQAGLPYLDSEADGDAFRGGTFYEKSVGGRAVLLRCAVLSHTHKS